MKSEVKDLESLRRELSALRSAGFHAVLMTGGADAYRKYLPYAREAGLELHAWIFTMMRGESVQAHPDWYAVSRSGVSFIDPDGDTHEYYELEINPLNTGTCC